MRVFQERTEQLDVVPGNRTSFGTMVPDTTDEAPMQCPVQVTIGFRQLNEVVECDAVDRDRSPAPEQGRVAKEGDSVMMNGHDDLLWNDSLES
jgi:hypothetical protein